MTPAIVQLLSTITPEGVSLGWSAIGERQIGLYAEERPAVARAAPVRRREVAAGRRAARRALVAAGAAKAAIPANPDRLPEWPNGIVGSISQTNRLAVAAVAHDPLPLA